MIERCKECGANLAMVGLRHRCIPRNTPEASGAARKAPSGPVLAGPSRKEIGSVSKAKRGEADHRSRLIPLKRGRPRVTGQRPWESEGMSRRTWYRRQAEKKK